MMFRMIVIVESRDLCLFEIFMLSYGSQEAINHVPEMFRILGINLQRNKLVSILRR